MSHRAAPRPPTWNSPRGTCRFCGLKIEEPRRHHWHEKCADEWLAATNRSAAHEFLLGRDGDQCRRCCGSLIKYRLHKGEEYEVLVDRWHAWPTGAEHLNYVWGIPRKQVVGPFRVVFWTRNIYADVDHVVPLIDATNTPRYQEADPQTMEGWRVRWQMAHGTANLQLLCAPCHAAKTAREAGERAKARRITGQQGLRRRKLNKREQARDRAQRWREMP